MARTFYTERDIQELAKQGVTEIEVNDDVSITDAAREMMDKLGMRRRMLGAPSPSSSSSSSASSATKSASLTPAEREQVAERVKSGVIARLGPGVDAAVVDRIVRRVVNAL